MFLSCRLRLERSTWYAHIVNLVRLSNPGKFPEGQMRLCENEANIAEWIRNKFAQRLGNGVRSTVGGRREIVSKLKFAPWIHYIVKELTRQQVTTLLAILQTNEETLGLNDFLDHLTLSGHGYPITKSIFELDRSQIDAFFESYWRAVHHATDPNQASSVLRLGDRVLLSLRSPSTQLTPGGVAGFVGQGVSLPV